MDYWKRQEMIDYILSLMLGKGLILDGSYNEFRKRLERKTDGWLINYLERVKEFKGGAEK